MSSRKYKRRIVYPEFANELRGKIIDDFFSFTRGDFDKIKTINDLGDICTLPITTKNMGIMLHRCQMYWKNYCRFNGLPDETHNILVKIIKKKWESLGTKETQ